MFNRKSSIAAGLLALGGLFAAGAAQAGDVHWSIGVNLPPIGTVVSNVPVYAPPVYQPVYQPAYRAPRHVYAPPPVVVYQPAPRVVYRPVPVYEPRYHEPRWERGPRHGGHGGHHHHHKGRGHGHGDRHR
jgi:hypothetical protein